jgi:nitroimidazol reductase NimA-like FMN-containing flavoprotein (pyridoxamine 5'-phosphate oxidase superfamily)
MSASPREVKLIPTAKGLAYGHLGGRRMSREVRRQDRGLSEDEAREILARAEHGVLASVGEDGWPYAVPLNHVLTGDVLYLHCALEGHKLENLVYEERVSYCVVASAEVVPSRLTTLYESAIVFGRATLVTNAQEKHEALKLLIGRFGGDSGVQLEESFKKWGSRTAVIRIQIERITGKAHRSTSTA